MPLSVTFAAALSFWTFPSHADTPKAQGDKQEQGKTLMITKGCSSCHQLTKLPAAKGLVGPPLDNMAAQSYIAGVLPNSRENLTQFLLEPQNFTLIRQCQRLILLNKKLGVWLIICGKSDFYP
ncbi:c-type cytochrome [Paraglaciecola sp. Hal342]